MTILSTADIRQTYAEAQRLQASGAAEAALKLYGRIVETNPNLPEVHFQIGRLFTEAFRIDRAVAHLQAAARLKPAEPAIWSAWADAAALAADPGAEQDFLAAIKAAPLGPSLRLPLQDRFGSARAISRPATGGVPPAEMSRLVALLGQGRYDQAARSAAALLKRAPKAAVVANMLASAEDGLGRRDAALAAFRLAVRIDPSYAEAHANLGRCLLDMGRVDDAVGPLRRAVMLTPANLPALVALGRALTRLGDADIALRFIDRALSIAPKNPGAWLAKGAAETRRRNPAGAVAAFLAAEAAEGDLAPEPRAMLAQAQARLGQEDAAMANFDRALQILPDLPLAVAGKAGLLQALGRFDEAAIWFRRAMQLEPANGETYRLFIASHKITPDDPILEQMRARFDDPSTPDMDRANLGFAIAKALEDTRQYAEVFGYLNAANALIRKAYPWDIGQRLAEIAETIRAQDGFDFAAASVAGTTDYAPIFVTGMPRSGTTLVEQIISSHAQVEGAGEVGEGTRVAQALLLQGGAGGLRHVSALSHEEIARLGHDYAAILRARFPTALHVTDKSIQTYLFMGLIRLALPKARFIVVRRDPRDTLLSIYKNKFPDGTHLYAYDQQDLARYWRSFEQMIEFWRDRLPGGFYEISYEALVADPEPQTRALIAACGLEWDDACLKFHENRRKVDTLSLFQVRQPISRGSLAGWKRYEAELTPMLEALGPIDQNDR